MNIRVIEDHFRLKHGLSADFHFYGWEALPHRSISRGAEPQYLLLRGGRCPLLKSGVNKGLPNFRKLSDEQSFVLQFSDEHDVLVAYERRHGHCSECGGEGRTACGWSKSHGTSYRECRRCKGDGKPTLLDTKLSPGVHPGVNPSGTLPSAPETSVEKGTKDA